MLAERAALDERVFLSGDVGRIAGVSLRQLQWWDERKVVSPRKEDHRRIYLPNQVLEILIVAVLRSKGLSLQKIRKVLRVLRRELEQKGNGLIPASKAYLVTDGKSVFVEDQPGSALRRVLEARSPVYLVSLLDQMKRITTVPAPRRYRSRQLELF